MAREMSIKGMFIATMIIAVVLIGVSFFPLVFHKEEKSLEEKMSEFYKLLADKLSTPSVNLAQSLKYDTMTTFGQRLPAMCESLGIKLRPISGGWVNESMIESISKIRLHTDASMVAFMCDIAGLRGGWFFEIRDFAGRAVYVNDQHELLNKYELRRPFINSKFVIMNEYAISESLLKAAQVRQLAAANMIIETDFLKLWNSLVDSTQGYVVSDSLTFEGLIKAKPIYDTLEIIMSRYDLNWDDLRLMDSAGIWGI